MMKYVILIPQPYFSPSIQLPKTSVPTATGPWPQQVIKPQEAPKFYPMHSSLEEEIHRLLISDASAKNNYWQAAGYNADVMEEFRHNGQDYEYLSEEEELPKPPTRRRKSKKPLPTECVFCKNNGEIAAFYKAHVLKDADGKVRCPILRKYECPICHEKGDNSHTLKYCPENPKPAGVPIVNALKNLRNASGKRRSK